MKIRAKLIVAFFLLSILPLSGIVGYSYFTSVRAFEAAVLVEGEQMTEQMTARLSNLRGGLMENLDALAAMPMPMPRRPDDPSFRRELAARLGNNLGLLEGLEWSRDRSAGSEMVMPVDAPDDASVDASKVAVVIQVGGRDPAGNGEEAHEMTILVPAPPGGVHPPAATRPVPREHLESVAATLGDRIEELSDRLEQEEKRAADFPPGDFHGAVDNALERQSLGSQIEKLETRREAMEALIGEKFVTPFMQNGEVVGNLRAAVRVPELLRQALEGARRSQGEIPFALDGEGKLYALDPAQAERLADIEEEIKALESDPVPRSTRTLGDWLVVTQRSPGSAVTFGIARPVAKPLAEIRRTAARNLGLGVGMIGLALLGILPVSGRMTRRLNELTAVAHHFAEGNLDARADVSSNDEIGALARSFNEMAAELNANQERILEQQVQQRVLESENKLKSEELEDARRFQLSLLPEGPPDVSGLEVCLFTRTAAEVGGDYYDYVQGDDGSLTLAIGDATGHGAMAGTMVAVVKSLFSALGPGREIEEFLHEASQVIRRMQLGRMQMAFAIAKFDSGEPGRPRKVSLSSAGMPPSLLYRIETGAFEEVDLPGLPLGANLDGTYQRVDVVLEPGDCLLAMSDGLPELRRADGEAFGYERLRRELEKLSDCTSQEVIEHLAGLVEEWGAGQRPNDDVTFTIVKVL